MIRNRIMISLAIAVVVLFCSLLAVFRLYRHEREESLRYRNNIMAIIKDNARQQELTVRELRDLYPKYDSLAKYLDIKSKRITNIVDTRYRFRDSVVTSTVLKIDSVSERSFFSIKDKCYDFSGYVEKDSISFTNKEFKDNITTFLYKDWEKKYLWGLLKFRPYYSVKVYSECMKDTIEVVNNIKIKD